MAKKSFLERLRERGWKESPSGWVPPLPGTSLKEVTSVRVKKVRHTGEGMNSLEARYVYEILEEEMRSGDIQCWFFESFRLRLAPKTFYTPDFMVIKKGGAVAFKEVKGFLREDASIKFKLAREIYPFFEFEMWSRNGGVWKERLPSPVSPVASAKTATRKKQRVSSSIKAP